MSDAIYPALPGLSWPVKRTPIWRSTGRQTATLREWRQTSMTYPRYRWTLQYEFLRGAAAYAEFQSLMGFFNARKGGYDTFLFTDPTDSSVTSQAFGTGDGSTTAFQLVRSMGGTAEPVFAVNGPPSIYKAGALQSSGYTISSGVVTFSTAPASGQALTWSGSYYWRVRFDADELEAEQFAANFWKTGQVKLKSDKA
jgi:uncharacterized protein (TIGR02217 family)